ncbi:MAG: hypothetical protein OHK0046_15210 [Anaerolineae bacterium]
MSNCEQADAIVSNCDRLLASNHGELSNKAIVAVRRIREIALAYKQVCNCPAESVASLDYAMLPPASTFKGWVDLLLIGSFGRLTTHQRKDLAQIRAYIDDLMESVTAQLAARQSA